MSQIIIDDQLDVKDVLPPLRKWFTVQRLGSLRPGQQILDDRVPQILRTLDQPTFITIDRDFWNARLCHTGYCILVFNVRDTEQELIPGLLRNLLRLRPFQTRTERMGKVARITAVRVDYWKAGQPNVVHVDWFGRGKKRSRHK